MRKICSFILALGCIYLCSCTSTKSILKHDNSVAFTESPEAVHLIAQSYELTGNYQKSFTAFDRMGKYHDFIIYDNNYIKMDGQVYAYKFRNFMNYQLSLNMFGTETNIAGSEKVIGFEGIMTSVDNPELTLNFIFSKDLFTKKHYRNRYEACKIPGIGFTGINGWNDGYIDSNGYWKSYDWSDYYETVFGTVKQDVKRKMYIAVEKM